MDVQPASLAQPSYPSAMAPPQAATAPGLGRAARFDSTGTGGELLGQVLIGVLLTIVTFGIYQPWLIVRMRKWMYSRTNLITPHGALQLSFEGTSLHGLLVPLTFGLYAFWLFCKQNRFYLNNSTFIQEG